MEKIDRIAQINKGSQEISYALDCAMSQLTAFSSFFPHAELSRRTRQVLFDEFFGELYLEINRVINKDESFNFTRCNLRLGLTKNVKIGKSTQFSLAIGIGYFFKRIFRFYGVLFAAVGIYLKVLLLNRKALKRRLTWVFNPSLKVFAGSNNAAGKFYEFCKLGNHKFLRDADCIVVWHGTFEKDSTKNLILTPNVYYELIKHSGPEIFSLAKLAFDSLKVGLCFTFECIKNPFLILLAPDFQKYPLVKCLNDSGCLENIVTNTSMIYGQEFWLHHMKDRKYSSHFLWYGMSVSNLKFKNVIDNEWAAIPLFYMENNYFWNEFHRKEAERVLGHIGNVPSMGVNLFILPKIRDSAKDKYKKNLLIFLNNPKSPEKMASIISRDAFYYGKYEVQEKFVLDILEISKNLREFFGQEHNIVIKTKRTYLKGSTDPRYPDLLDKLEASGCLFFDVESQDLVNEVVNSDVVFCTPTSTPVFLGIEHGVPSIYYDPIDVVDPAGYSGTDIVWVSSKSGLDRQMRNILVPK